MAGAGSWKLTGKGAGSWELDSATHRHMCGSWELGRARELAPAHDTNEELGRTSVHGNWATPYVAATLVKFYNTQELVKSTISYFFIYF